MTQYTIHEPSAPPASAIARADATQFVKEGMAWWALFLPMIWLLYHRMWLALLGFVLALILLEVGLTYAGASESVSTWVSILFSVIFAMHANDLRRWTLSRRGFSMVGAVSASGRDACELKYFATWPETDAAAIPPAVAMTSPNPLAARRKRDDGDAVIGLFPDGR